MKFSKSARNTFQSDNYNPPPGYYTGVDSKDNAIKFQPATTTFLKCDRFSFAKEDTHPEYKTIEGFDKIAYESSFKKALLQAQLFARNYVTKSQTQLRQKSIVHKKTAKNLLEQLQSFLNNQLSISPEGQMIKQKHEVLLQQLQMISNYSPGPGQYDIKNTLTKPRTQACFIKSGSQNHKVAQSEASTDILLLQTMQKPDSAGSMNLKRKQQKYIPRDVPNEYNIEQIMARDKNDPRKQKGPAPGQYEIDSCFGKVKDFNLVNQCFDSREPRFKQVIDEKPGPGEYQTDKQKLIGGYVSKMPRQQISLNDNVGVGTYTVKEISKPERRDGRFPSSFGSGSKRLYETMSDTPGPGTYQQPQKKKGPKYAFKIKEKRTIEPIKPLSFGLAVSNEVIQVVKKRSVSANKPNQHMFSSGVPRFKEQEQYDLGPGAYEQNEQFVKNTYNRSQALFSKSPRQKDLNAQKLGPGSYDNNYQLVKKNIVKDILF